MPEICIVPVVPGRTLTQGALRFLSNDVSICIPKTAWELQLNLSHSEGRPGLSSGAYISWMIDSLMANDSLECSLQCSEN